MSEIIVNAITTYNSPKHAFQFQDDFLIFALKTMPSDERSKFAEVPFRQQHLTPKVRFSHNTVEMWRYNPIEGAVNHRD